VDPTAEWSYSTRSRAAATITLPLLVAAARERVE
jgi:hypothetical protein